MGQKQSTIIPSEVDLCIQIKMDCFQDSDGGMNQVPQLPCTHYWTWFWVMLISDTSVLKVGLSA